jgi:hypothetical protein
MIIGDAFVPREDNGGVPVNVQDQATKMLNLFFIQPLGDSTTLAVPSVVDSRTINVADATGFVDGNYLGIFAGLGKFYFGTQLGAPAGNVITLDTPLDFVFPAGAIVLNFTREMAVDGSVTPQVFQIGPIGVPLDLRIDVTKLVVSMVDNLEMDDSKFGGNGALTRGCVLRKRNGEYDNEANWKKNRDIGIYAGRAPAYTDKAGSGAFGAYFEIRFAGQDNRGVTRRLEPGDVLEVLIQDDLTALTSFEMMAQGHIVQDRRMANPDIITIPVSVWTKVATDVVTGSILPLENGPNYVYTIRDTGEDAPDDGDYSEAKGIPWEGERISSSVGIDVYLSVSEGSEAGEVRVDL